MKKNHKEEKGSLLVIKKQNIKIYNEEVREIMKEIPGRVIHGGLTIIFLSFASIVIGSYFYQFNEIVSAPIIITTINPPAPIICRASGRISHWFVSNGQIVKKGEYIALIDNLIDLNDFSNAEEIICHLNSNKIRENILITKLPEKLTLGDLEDVYNRFYRDWQSYKKYVENNFLPRKMELLINQMEKQEQQYQLLLKQQQMMIVESDIERKGLFRYKNFLDNGSISESKLEDKKVRVIQAERDCINFLTSMKTTEISLIKQKLSLLELQEQYRNEIEQFESNIYDNIVALKKLLKGWKYKHLLISPIDGTLTVAKFWSENHVVSTGDRLATIVPIDSSAIICNAVIPSSGIGKVQVGQKVNVKLFAYPYMEHGMLTGQVQSISIVPEKEGYIVEIRLNEGMMSNYNEHLKLFHEMEGTAEIVTKKMRMIYRLINPLKMMFAKSK